MLDREQGGRLVRQIWIEQVFKHIPNPKESYVQPWENMPEWERETDRAIFEAIAEAVRQELAKKPNSRKKRTL